jgi:hypothetical protein
LSGFRGPLFVVGMNGSGTTMLMDSLSHHTALYAFPRETRLLPYFMARLVSYGPLENDDNFRRLFDEFRSVSHFRRTNGGMPVPLPEDWRLLPRSLATVVDQVYRYFAAQDGKPVWCEKTPMNVLHIEALGALFPDARFVHIIRDARDSAASFHRRWRFNPFRTVYRWKHAVAEGRRQGAALPGRYMELRYEDVTRDPERWMRAIADFLGIPFELAMLESSQPYLDAGSRPLDPAEGIVENSGNWARYFSARDIARQERICGRLLHELGYAVSDRTGDADPGKLSLQYWLITDLLVRGAQEIWINLRSPRNGRSWGILFAHFGNALKQRRTTRY